MKRHLLTLVASAFAVACAAARVDVYPQCFEPGGWSLDPQFMDVMGSPYLIAHGLGVRVMDATARVTVPEAGEWRVWVRTRRWVEGAGSFKVSVGASTLPAVFGRGKSEWTWECGGAVKLAKGEVELRLVDLDGFDGRCAGVVLTQEATPPEGALTPTTQPVAETVKADFVVVGGGLPGTCAAVAAARRGIKVALVQDRPMLGGNASSEIRVWSGGEARYDLVRELRGRFMNRDGNLALCDARRMRIVADEANIALHMNTRAFGVEKNADGTIAAVKALDLKRNCVVRFEAPLFCDATGDGWVGYWAGADWKMGREAKSEYDEERAPEKADGDTLGASLMWTSVAANAPVSFSAPWAEPHAQGIEAVNGEWNWEYGIHRDMIADGEAIRDRLLLAIYGAFSLAKKRPENANRVLDLCPFLLGKRESRRIMGDWVYSEKDVTARRRFEDAIASGSWGIDLHYDNYKKGVDFLTTCYGPQYGRYWIPYRSIYSRNVANLFMAGRCFSCTHVGLGGPRVINTLSQLGVAAGEAAAMCRELGETPRGIYTNGHVRKLQRRLGGAFPGSPDPTKSNWRFVDDESKGVKFGKGWRRNHNSNGEQVGDFAHFAGKSAEDAVYPLPVQKEGRYVLMGRVPYSWGAKPGSKMVCEIASGGQVKALTIDQAQGTGMWQKLGEFDLAPGATLKIMPAKSSGYVVADGFALVPAVAPKGVPELMRTFGGAEVKTLGDWQKVRAPELLAKFEKEEYGRRPAAANDRSRVSFDVYDVSEAMGGSAIRKLVRVTYKGPNGTFSFPFTAYIPKAAKPVPAFIFAANIKRGTLDEKQCLSSYFWPVEEIVSRGYATAAFRFDVVAADKKGAGFSQGVFPAVQPEGERNDESWATLSAWAWADSRILDWMETEPLIDAKHVGVVGHSRGGKTAIWAGVTDQRFAMVCSNNSGCSGAKLNHIDLPKSEHINQICGNFPYWFCGNYLKYAGKEMEMDFDQHELLALIAPRLLCVASATGDDWAGPRGEWWAAKLASRAWELHGVRGLVAESFPVPEEPQQLGCISYHLRTGSHLLSSYDWKCYMDFADRHGWR